MTVASDPGVRGNRKTLRLVRLPGSDRPEWFTARRAKVTLFGERDIVKDRSQRGSRALGHASMVATDPSTESFWIHSRLPLGHLMGNLIKRSEAGKLQEIP